MSRNIKNPGLASLCAAADLQIAELEGILCCHQTSLHQYAAGRKPLPRIEAGLAAVFKLSIPELRKILFERVKNGKRKFEIGHSRLKAGDPMAAYRTPIWHWDGKTESFLNRFENYADDPNVRDCIVDGKQHPRGAEIRIKKLPLGHFRAALFVR